MALGNLIQGTAKGRLGDIVLYRQAGQQHSRLRIRNPYNPRTNAQKYQRAVVATVMQAYSAGKEIFDHSFQGLPVGRRNMQYFLKRNITTLRSMLASELNAQVTDRQSVATFVAPGAVTAMPFPGMMVSHGSYNFANPILSSYSVQWAIPVPGGFPDTVTVPCSDILEYLPLVPDDYYTFVGFYLDKNQIEYQVTDNDYARQFSSNFFFIRFRVKGDLLNSDEAINGKTFADFFELDAKTDNVNPAALLSMEYPWSELYFDKIIGHEGSPVFMSLIRSRRDRDLRSTSFLYFDSGVIPAGITYRYLLQAWSNIESNIDDPELILEGGSSEAF